MKDQYNPEIHHRRSIRLPAYDYAQVGAYFITICTYNRECLFGNIDKGDMQLNDFGNIVEEEWWKSSVIRKEIELDEFVVMPNHTHGIIKIVNETDSGGEVQPVAPTSGPSPRSLGALVAGFKGAVSKRINAIRQTPGGTVWQRNYHERIIRNQEEYNHIAGYIARNPQQWTEDSLHPEAGEGRRVATAHLR